MHEDSSQQIRAEAAYVASFWFDEEAARELLRCCRDSSQPPAVRAQAVEGLGNVLETLPRRSWQRGSAIAVRALLDHPDARVRFWACYAAGAMRLRGALRRLKTLADSDHRLCPGMWKVSEEAQDVITFFTSGVWPERRRTR